jgi:hypothetical protein
MPSSVRIIRVLNDTYTVETEIEAEDTKSLMKELSGTQWGLKIASLLEEMLPEVKPKPNIYETRERLEHDYAEEINNYKIDHVDLGENPSGEEILVVWLNQPVPKIPEELNGFKIEIKQTPSYYEPSPPQSYIEM